MTARDDIAAAIQTVTCNARCPHHGNDTSPNCTLACPCPSHERGNITLSWPAP